MNPIDKQGICIDIFFLPRHLTGLKWKSYFSDWTNKKLVWCFWIVLFRYLVMRRNSKPGVFGVVDSIENSSHSELFCFSFLQLRSLSPQNSSVLQLENLQLRTLLTQSFSGWDHFLLIIFLTQNTSKLFRFSTFFSHNPSRTELICLKSSSILKFSGS